MMTIDKAKVLPVDNKAAADLVRQYWPNDENMQAMADSIEFHQHPNVFSSAFAHHRLASQSGDQGEAVGHATAMVPSTGMPAGFTVCAFNEQVVPVGTPLYTHPAPADDAAVEYHEIIELLRKVDASKPGWCSGEVATMCERLAGKGAAHG